MPSAQTLRAVEKSFDRLSWLSFAVGVVMVLALCGSALLGRVAPAPEEFLVQLGIVLAASLAPTLLFRAAAVLCRRHRAGKPALRSILDSVALLDDSITR
jgi:hypothetical protein